jgi:cobalt-zinc-cadmium resistance protein CzcA
MNRIQQEAIAASLGMQVEELADSLYKQQVIQKTAGNYTNQLREQAKLAKKRGDYETQIKLEKGYHITWNGEFENQVRATNQLKVVVPVSLVLIFLWLFVMFGNFKDAGMVLLNVPFALIGGIMCLYFTGVNFSISAGVGFIALFGVCVQNGVILINVFKKNIEDKLPLRDAILNGAVSRLRPVVMTALMAGLGLLPAALSTGIGSETQRPLALVVIGGLITATILTFAFVFDFGFCSSFGASIF